MKFQNPMSGFIPFAIFMFLIGIVSLYNAVTWASYREERQQEIHDFAYCEYHSSPLLKETITLFPCETVDSLEIVKLHQIGPQIPYANQVEYKRGQPRAMAGCKTIIVRPNVLKKSYNDRRNLIIHELGHVVYDGHLSEKQRRKFQKLWNREGAVSGYGDENEDEAFAEAVTMYVNSGSIMRDKYPQQHEFLLENVFEREFNTALCEEKPWDMTKCF